MQHFLKVACGESAPICALEMAVAAKKSEK
jgi:hypothetical protein